MDVAPCVVEDAQPCILELLNLVNLVNLKLIVQSVYGQMVSCMVTLKGNHLVLFVSKVTVTGAEFFLN